MKKVFDKKFILIIPIIVLIIFGTIGILKNKNETILIQLSAQGQRQMMGYIIKTENEKIIVIDGGTIDDTNNLINHINELGGKVDYWFITHAHDDHAGAFLEIVNNTEIEIDNIYVSLNSADWYIENEEARSEFSKNLINIVENSRIAEGVNAPNVNDVIEIDNLKIDVLKVCSPEVTENAGNEQSMVLKFNTNDTSILFLGDIGTEGSDWLIENQKDKLKSDIVQMSHHGQNGASEELYEIISPDICLWPTPEWLWNNDNGGGYSSGNWTTLETKGWMENLNVKEHYVSKDGDLSVVLE